MEGEEDASVNSELRFLTIELTKLAAQNGTTFDDELEEFIGNAYKLRSAILGMPSTRSFSADRPHAAGKLRR